MCPKEKRGNEWMKSSRTTGEWAKWESPRERERARENVHKNDNTVQLQCPSVQTKIQ